MIANLKNYLYEPKSKIGWVHGLIACIGALFCAYLTMMIFTSLARNDYALRIIPSIILTPILICAYSLYFLFTQKIISVIKKIFTLLFVLLIILIISMKGF